MNKTPEEIVKAAREAFNFGRTKSVEFREKQLKALWRMYEENGSEIVEALREDLHKSKQEAILSELDYMKNDLRVVLYNLKSWAKPEKVVEKNLTNLMDSTYIYNDPYGVVLIIGPWNYPINLVFMPLAGAIAAGNCVVVKPSEVAPMSAKLIAKLVPKYLDQECYHVYLGGVPETTELLKQRFDYIFFTGSSAVGKIVHQAAARHLTPTTLELGGKSPVYIHESADIDITAKRIMWGKCFNSGQSCISPDYILCSKEVQEKFIIAAKRAIASWYGDKPKQSPDYGRIINERHCERVVKLLENSIIAFGGNYDVSERYIEPTILADVSPGDAVMQEEIFGPVLPIINISNPKEAIDFINEREKPLALYVFTNDQAVADLFLNNTSSGGAVVNDTMMHFTMDCLPFGGVGNSGMGSYHGKKNFDLFVHKKGTLIKDLSKLGEVLTSSRYPPFTDGKLSIILAATRKHPYISFKYVPHILAFFFGVIFMALLQKFV